MEWISAGAGCRINPQLTGNWKWWRRLRHYTSHWILRAPLKFTLLYRIHSTGQCKVYRTLSALLYFVTSTGHYQLYNKLSSLLGIVKSTVHCQLYWTLSTILDTVNSSGHCTALHTVLQTDTANHSVHCTTHSTASCTKQCTVLAHSWLRAVRSTVHYPIFKSDVLDFNSSSTSHFTKGISQDGFSFYQIRHLEICINQYLP